MNALPLRSGEIYRASARITCGPHAYSGLSNSGASGPIFIHGYDPSDEDNCFRIEDGASDLSFDGLDFSYMWRPTWITKAARVRFSHCHWHHARQEGCLIGFGEDCSIEDSLIEYCGPEYGPPGYSDQDHHEGSADHGDYFGSGGKRNSIRRTTIRKTAGAGIHLNWSSEEGGMQEQFHAEDVEVLYCGSDGTHAWQPDATVDVRVALPDGTFGPGIVNTLTALYEVGPIAFYHDGEGPARACKRWLLDRGTIYGPDAKTNIHVCQGTEDITFRRYVIVMADDRICADAERTDKWAPYIPTFEECWIYCRNPARQLTDAIVRNNRILAFSEVAALFPLASRGDFTPTDPSAPGFRDWRGAPVNPPPPPPPPNPSPSTPDLLAARAALQDATAALGKVEEGNNAMASLIQNVARRALKKALAETNAGEALNLRDAKSAVARARKAVGE